jgi:hypothetical protein
MVESRRDSGQLVWGVVLLAVGLAFLLANFGYGAWFDWGRWWPLILIAVGVGILVRRSREPASGQPAGVPPPATAGGETTTVGGTTTERLPAGRKNFPTGAVILIGIGLAFFLDDALGSNAFPALVLMAVGVALVLRSRWPR